MCQNLEQLLGSPQAGEAELRAMKAEEQDFSAINKDEKVHPDLLNQRLKKSSVKR